MMPTTEKIVKKAVLCCNHPLLQFLPPRQIRQPNLGPGLVVALLLLSFQRARLAFAEEMPPFQILPPFLSDLHEHDVRVEELFPLGNLSQGSCMDHVSLSLAGQHVGAAGVVDL